MVLIACFKSRQEKIEFCLNEFKHFTLLDSKFKMSFLNHQHQLVLNLFLIKQESLNLCCKAILATEIRQKYKLQTKKHKTIFKKFQINGFGA